MCAPRTWCGVPVNRFAGWYVSEDGLGRLNWRKRVEIPGRTAAGSSDATASPVLAARQRPGQTPHSPSWRWIGLFAAVYPSGWPIWTPAGGDAVQGHVSLDGSRSQWHFSVDQNNWKKPIFFSRICTLSSSRITKNISGFNQGFLLQTETLRLLRARPTQVRSSHRAFYYLRNQHFINSSFLLTTHKISNNDLV